jgi:hypothetical protein
MTGIIMNSAPMHYIKIKDHLYLRYADLVSMLQDFAGHESADVNEWLDRLLDALSRGLNED